MIVDRHRVVKQSKSKNQSSKPNSFSQFRGFSFIAFWNALGQPINEMTGAKCPVFDYEEDVLKALENFKLIWIKKARGLGITELMLRYMIWLCVRDDSMKGKQMAIIAGLKWDSAIEMTDRIKRMLQPFGLDESKSGAVELNGCKILAFPSNHTETLRSYTAMKFILLDEADFFQPREFEDVRAAAEGYIAKSAPAIVMVSTPNLPGGQYEQIENDKTSPYHKIYLPYTVGMGKMYTEDGIKAAMLSPKFEREYNLKYGYGVGNIFPELLLQAITKEEYDLSNTGGQTVIAVDPAFGSSKFAILVMQDREHIGYVLDAQQFERPSPAAMYSLLVEKSNKYGRCTIAADGSRPEITEELNRLGANAVAVNFSKELGKMTTNAAQAIAEKRVRIHPAYRDLIYQLRAVEYNAKGHPDKDKLTFDLGDAFMIACHYLLKAGAGVVVKSKGPYAPKHYKAENTSAFF